MSDSYGITGCVEANLKEVDKGSKEKAEGKDLLVTVYSHCI